VAAKIFFVSPCKTARPIEEPLSNTRQPKMKQKPWEVSQLKCLTSFYYFPLQETYEEAKGKTFTSFFLFYVTRRVVSQPCTANPAGQVSQHRLSPNFEQHLENFCRSQPDNNTDQKRDRRKNFQVRKK